MIKKCLGLIVGLLLLTGCSEFALLSSGSSIALSNNVYAKAYSGVDLTTYLTTNKDIKTHAYEKVITLTKKVNETFILKKPEMLAIEKNIGVAIPVIKVEVSEIFQPDNNLVLASTLTYPIEDEVWTTKEWDRYSVLLAVVVVSALIFLSSLIYLGIYIITSQREIKIIIKKKNTTRERIKNKKKKRRKN